MSDIDRPTRDEPLLLALARGLSVRDSASEAGLSEATAFRRLRDATFVAELNRLRGELWSATLGKLTAASGKAVDRIVLLVDEGESDSVRLSACKSILELGTKLRDSIEFAQRLELLENPRHELSTTDAA